MKEALLIAQERICLPAAFWHAANLFSTALPILPQTILSSSPSTSSWSRHQNELLSPTIALETSTMGERRQKGRDTVLIEGREWLQSHITFANPKRTVPRADTCSAGSGSVWGSPSTLSPFTIPSLGTSLSPGLVRASTPKVLCYYGEATNFKVNYD